MELWLPWGVCEFRNPIDAVTIPVFSAAEAFERPFYIDLSGAAVDAAVREAAHVLA